MKGSDKTPAKIRIKATTNQTLQRTGGNPIFCFLFWISWLVFKKHSLLHAPSNGLRYLRWGGDGEAVQLEKS